MDFSGQESYWSCSCNLRCSCGNARCFNPLCSAGDQTYILELQRCPQSHCSTTGTPDLCQQNHFYSLLLVVSLLCFYYVPTFFFFFFFWEPYLWHMEVPRLGVISELQLPAYTTATIKWDPSGVYDLYHRSQQCRICNPLSGAIDSSWVCYL